MIREIFIIGIMIFIQSAFALEDSSPTVDDSSSIVDDSYPSVDDAYPSIDDSYISVEGSYLPVLPVDDSYQSVDDSYRLWLGDVDVLAKEIELISQDDGPFSETLYDPLISLAQLYIEQGETEDAEDALRRAQNITHRNEGVYSPKQLEVIELLTDLALMNDEFDDANQHHKFSFFINRHHLGLNNPEGLYAYSELAEWYMQTGQPQRARRLLKEAVTLANDHGRDTLQFALMIDRARRLQGLCCKPGPLIDVVRNVPNSESNSDPDNLAQAYLALADLSILGRKRDAAYRYFLMAAELTPLLSTSDPKAISIKREVRSQLSHTPRSYRIQPDPFAFGRRLERLSPSEMLDHEMQPPQWFLFDPEQLHMAYKTNDLNETSGTERRTQTLVGYPLKFDLEQLRFILPPSLQTLEAMAQLEINVSFSVTDLGDLLDIEVIETNAPQKLNRLIKDSLKKVYFRPQLIDGVPIATDHVTLDQTFTSRFES
jgi:tetratricopeptide (TPR) repeat protein